LFSSSIGYFTSEILDSTARRIVYIGPGGVVPESPHSAQLFENNGV
jgi:hypothetical protein